MLSVEPQNQGQNVSAAPDIGGVGSEDSLAPKCVQGGKAAMQGMVEKGADLGVGVGEPVA